MRIRTFTADTAQAAMAQVRAEMGPDAVIIAMDDTAKGGGVMVRAAVEHAVADFVSDAIDGGDAGSSSESEDRLEQLLKARLRPARRATPARVDDAVAAALLFHRVPEKIAAALMLTAAESGLADGELALAHAVDRHAALAPLPALPVRPVLLVGTPGAGKTSVAARLALRASTSGAAPLLVTLDGDKAGARAQIETYAGLMKIKVHAAEDSHAAKAIAAGHKDGPVIVDSPGMNVFAASDLKETRDMIAGLEADAVAVMPAGIDAEEAADMASLYAAAGVKRFICTRIDTARRLGAIFAASANGLGLSHMTSSPFIGRGLDAPHALKLARLLLDADTAGFAKENQT